jgi:hypothetical protein
MSAYVDVESKGRLADKARMALEKVGKEYS